MALEELGGDLGNSFEGIGALDSVNESSEGILNTGSNNSENPLEEENLESELPLGASPLYESSDVEGSFLSPEIFDQELERETSMAAGVVETTKETLKGARGSLGELSLEDDSFFNERTNDYSALENELNSVLSASRRNAETVQTIITENALNESPKEENITNLINESGAEATNDSEQKQASAKRLWEEAVVSNNTFTPHDEEVFQRLHTQSEKDTHNSESDQNNKEGRMQLNEAFREFGFTEFPENENYESLRKRYLELARTFHPDAGFAPYTEKMQRVNEAWELMQRQYPRSIEK